MTSMGYSIEPPGERHTDFTRIYVHPGDDVQRETSFFYQEGVPEEGSHVFDAPIKAYGDVVTYHAEPALTLTEKMEILEKTSVRTERDYYKFMRIEERTWYETAAMLKEKFGAMVHSEQTGEEINPTRPIDRGYALSRPHRID
jgi:hypothetical protein